MKFRAKQRLLAVLIVGLFSLPAVAQFTRDASANKKIDEAINNHYLMMQLDKAEGLLTGTIQACEDKCSPQTKAKAWMYVGIVRGSGKNDLAGAQEAFEKAKSLDPAVKLDNDLASDETKSTFAAAVGGAAPAATPAAPVLDEAPAAPAAVPATPAPGAKPPPAGVPGDMLCSPQGTPLGVDMPIPVSCTSDAEVSSGFIKFKEPGGSDWKKVKLMNIDGMWQAEIPCDYTKKAGTMNFYVGVKNAAGEYVDQFGSKKQPASFLLDPAGSAGAFPGQAPVAKCGAASNDCPPDFPGCGDGGGAAPVCGDLDWGAACSNSAECKCGLLCEEGACATAPSCSADTDCETGSCIDGKCGVAGGEEPSTPAGPFKKSWLSVGVGMDFMPMGGVDLCSPFQDFDETYGIQCYDANTLARREQQGVTVNTGLAPAQLRLKLGYDYAVMDHLTVGAKVGFALMNTHPKAEGEVAFLPVHVEGRVGYTFTPLGNAGLRPAVYLAGGLAESNARLNWTNPADPNDKLRVYKVAGRIFGAVGGKLGYAVTDNMVVNADVQAMFMIPAGGFTFVLHPGLSAQYGF